MSYTKENQQEEVAHLDPQTLNIEQIRIEKLISLFSPLYKTSKTLQMKLIYKRYLDSLKLDLKKIKNNKK